jgi:uncharacterized protein DUF6325
MGADLDATTRHELDEMGPIDYAVIAWPDRQPTGSAAPLILDLVDRGIVRVLDIAFVGKDDNGVAFGIDLAELAEETGFGAFDGAATGTIGDSDLEEVAQGLDPGTSAAVIVWENRWAAAVGAELRRSGAQLVDMGRIPIQAMLAALDATEPTT